MQSTGRKAWCPESLLVILRACNKTRWWCWIGSFSADLKLNFNGKGNLLGPKLKPCCLFSRLISEGLQDGAGCWF